MSDLEEKLQPVRHSIDDVARQTLGQLRKRWGVQAELERPDVIRVNAMDHVEVWRRAENGTRGESTTYELQRGTP